MFPIQSYSYVKLHITGRYKESIKLYLITLTQQGSTNDDHSILEMIGFEFDYFVFNCVFILLIQWYCYITFFIPSYLDIVSFYSLVCLYYLMDY